MEYTKRSVNGDAGEYLVAYTITKILQWPCRLYGVDLGVDAEMEVINDDGSSSGDIIKIQVKAVDAIKSVNTVSVYVDDRHIDYWKKFCLPVIVCCVDLSKETIYWKQITATEAFNSKGESKKVNFCLQHDKLNLESKPELQSLACPPESKNLAPLFIELHEKFKLLPSADTEYMDFDALADIEMKCKNVESVLDKIEPLLTHFPWRISTITHREYSQIKDSLRITRNNMSYHFSVLADGG